MMTSAGQFYILEEHIQVHRYYMGMNFKRDISYQEAVTHWYDTVYLPVIKIIRKQGLQHDFPGRTEADLYLWIAEHRSEIEQSLGDTIRTDLAASDLAKSGEPGAPGSLPVSVKSSWMRLRPIPWKPAHLLANGARTLEKASKNAACSRISWFQ